MAPTPDLQSELKALIKPWRKSEEEPPFSLSELAAMALIFSEDELDMREIAAWIAANFDFYRAQIFTRLWAREFEDWDWPARDTEPLFFESLWEALCDFKLPVSMQDNTEAYDDPEDKNCYTFRISSAAARIYFKHRLSFKPSGTFSFLSLPAELRNTIYEMVLSYPQSGLQISKHRPGERAVTAVSRDHAETFHFDPWQIAARSLHLPPLRHILALTLVNKQIFKEAMPYFYQLNTFYATASDTTVLLRNLAPSRRQYVTTLSLSYDGPWQGQEHPFQILSSLIGLRNLTVAIDETGWFSGRKNRRGGQIYHAGNIPGFDTLLEMTDRVDVKLFGECPTIAANWKTETRKVMEAETRARERRLKRIKAPAVGTKQPARAAKARKINMSDDIDIYGGL